MSVTYNYKTSIKSIYTIEDLLSKELHSPECQRPIDESHITDFYEFQKKYYIENNVFLFIHNIVLCVLNNKDYVIDGQHRVEALRLLYNDSFYPKEAFLKNTIFVTVLYASNEDELKNHFVMCNKNKPLCPDISNEQIDFYKPVEVFLRKNFNKYHKNTKTPRAPNWNIDNVMNEIKNLEFHKHITKDKFIQEIENCNLYYRKNIDSQKITNLESRIKKSKSIQENYLVLSLFYKFEWLRAILYKILQKIDYDKIPNILHTRQNIKKTLRSNVWRKRNETLDGECYCCSKKMNYDDFECGHIISVFHRGETNINNLEPICSTCNKDMGVRNLEDFRKEIRKELNLIV